ncbi:hypothetical protein NEAUS03_0828 [Nematocida ausubeli]|nr:hypothetical protein NEAUS03_0828 [Nematocida ausubeli]
MHEEEAMNEEQIDARLSTLLRPLASYTKDKSLLEHFTTHKLTGPKIHFFTSDI